MLHIENLNWWYSSSEQIFHDFNLDLFEGDFCFLLWKSGSGKTSLIKLLMWQLSAPARKIEFEGHDVTQMSNKKLQQYRSDMGVIFQDFRLIDRQTIEQNIKIHKHQDPNYRESLITELWLQDKLQKKPPQLSGGEKQRVAICRAVAHKPKILFADEPTGNLDFETAKTIWKILIDLNKQWQTILCITHNDNLVERIKQQIQTKVITL